MLNTGGHFAQVRSGWWVRVDEARVIPLDVPLEHKTKDGTDVD